LKNSKLIISTALDTEEIEDHAETGPDVELRHLVIGECQHGMRLDKALVELVPEFSRSYIQQLIDLDGVKINGSIICKSSTRVKAGELGLIELRPTPQSQAFKPEAMDLNIEYEDEHLLIVNKPSGLVVHPAPGNWTGTLLNGLLAYDPTIANLPRAGIVHRLDKDTSGLMVVARTRSVMDALIRAIAARDVGRKYVALAHKTWIGARARSVNEPIGRDPRNRLRMAVVDLEKTPGKLAKTDIELLQNTERGCFVRCTLHTGRTHQIRVHMACIGHSLVADELYGGQFSAGMKRQALHAYRLSFKHPVTDQMLDFSAPFPIDLVSALSAWGISYNQNML
jgi:23S rRNA pseudouridine1911/1915/1917 synthase